MKKVVVQNHDGVRTSLAFTKDRLSRQEFQACLCTTSSWCRNKVRVFVFQSIRCVTCGTALKKRSSSAVAAADLDVTLAATVATAPSPSVSVNKKHSPGTIAWGIQFGNKALADVDGALELSAFSVPGHLSPSRTAAAMAAHSRFGQLYLNVVFGGLAKRVPMSVVLAMFRLNHSLSADRALRIIAAAKQKVSLLCEAGYDLVFTGMFVAVRMDTGLEFAIIDRIGAFKSRRVRHRARVTGVHYEGASSVVYVVGSDPK